MKKKHLKEKNLEEKKKQEEEETIEGIVKLCNSRSFLYAFLVKTSFFFLASPCKFGNLHL